MPGSVGSQRTRYKKSAGSRQQVLDAAIAVLATQGITATSVQGDGLALHQEIDPISRLDEAHLIEALEATAVSLFEL